MIPPDANAAFVATMEDFLEVYQRPHDPQRPLVCLDETSKQLIIETRAPIPAKPGQPARRDYEYERNARRAHAALQISLWAPSQSISRKGAIITD